MYFDLRDVVYLLPLHNYRGRHSGGAKCISPDSL